MAEIPKPTERQARQIIRQLIDEGLENADIRDQVADQFRINRKIVLKWIMLARRERREEIISTVQRLLEARYHTGEIKRLISTQYDISPWTTLEYLRLARERLRELTNRDGAEHHQDAYGFYLSIMRDTNQPVASLVRHCPGVG